MSAIARVLYAVDRARSRCALTGCHVYTIKIRRRLWSGARVGEGSATDTDLDLVYAGGGSPSVRTVSTRQVASSGGTFREGDFEISEITPRYTTPVSGGYTPTQLNPTVALDNEECFYVLLGPEGEIHCTPVKFVFDDACHYVVYVRPRRETP